MRRRYGSETRWAQVNLYMTAYEVEKHFGKMCKEYEPLCGCCAAWLEWNRTGRVTLTVEREDVLKVI